jgi:hypothetical protein
MPSLFIYHQKSFMLDPLKPPDRTESDRQDILAKDISYEEKVAHIQKPAIISLNRELSTIEYCKDYGLKGRTTEAMLIVVYVLVTMHAVSFLFWMQSDVIPKMEKEMNETAKEYNISKDHKFLRDRFHRSQREVKVDYENLALLPGLSPEAKVPLILLGYLAFSFCNNGDEELSIFPWARRSFYRFSNSLRSTIFGDSQDPVIAKNDNWLYFLSRQIQSWSHVVGIVVFFCVILREIREMVREICLLFSTTTSVSSTTTGSIFVEFLKHAPDIISGVWAGVVKPIFDPFAKAADCEAPLFNCVLRHRCYFGWVSASVVLLLCAANKVFDSLKTGNLWRVMVSSHQAHTLIQIYTHTDYYTLTTVLSLFALGS